VQLELWLSPDRGMVLCKLLSTVVDQQRFIVPELIVLICASTKPHKICIPTMTPMLECSWGIHNKQHKYKEQAATYPIAITYFLRNNKIIKPIKRVLN